MNILRHALAAALPLCLCLLVTCGVSSPARADEASDAKALFVEGTAAAREGRLSAAEALLAKSRVLHETANTLLNLAIVQQRLGRHLDTLDTLDALDARADVADDPQRRAKSDTLRATSMAEVCVLEAHLSPADAELFVDDEPRVAPVRLMPGRHTLIVRAQGYTPSQQELELRGGERRKVDVTLEEIARPQGTEATPNAPVSPLVPAPSLQPVSIPDHPRPERRRSWRIAAITTAAILAVAAGTVGVVLLTRDDSPEGDPF